MPVRGRKRGSSGAGSSSRRGSVKLSPSESNALQLISEYLRETTKQLNISKGLLQRILSDKLNHSVNR